MKLKMCHKVADGMDAVPTSIVILGHWCRVEIYLDRLKQRQIVNIYRILLIEQFSVDRACSVPTIMPLLSY